MILGCSEPTWYTARKLLPALQTQQSTGLPDPAPAGTHIAVIPWHGELPEPSPSLTDPTAPSHHQHVASHSQTTELGRGTDPAKNHFVGFFFLSFFLFPPHFLSLGSVLSWSRSPVHFTLQLHKHCVGPKQLCFWVLVSTGLQSCCVSVGLG